VSHEINVKVGLSEKNSQMQVHTCDVGLHDLYFMKKMEMKPKIHSTFTLLDETHGFSSFKKLFASRSI
jgi:hypothetical protein